MTLVTSTLRAADGAQLHVAHQLPQGAPKAVVLLVHGYAEHSGRYQHVIDALSGAGYAVYTLDHRSHGRSEGVRAYVESIHQVAADLYLYFQGIKAAHPGVKCFVYGHSMGALISLVFAIEHQREIDGLITSGAPVLADANVAPAMVTLGKILHRIAPKLALLPFGDEGVLSRDPQVDIAVNADPLHYTGSMRVGTGMAINTAAQWARDRLEELRLPLLAFHGAADALVTPKGSEMLHARARSADKTLTLYPDMRHEPHNEIGKEQVIADVIAWLNRHV
ncbi:MAG: lysophospholipase [Anaerolineae bacterium]|nr:lysophospholipase [Anaerolineae bacterium]